MPTLSIWSIRLALGYLVMGTSFGVAATIQKAYGLTPLLWLAIPLHVQAILYGWTLQLIIGVAYWMLPTFGARTNRGREAFAIASVVLLNAAIVLCLAFPVLSTALTTSAAVAFAVHAWPRLKAFAEHA
jgi:hypothetical protein